MIFSSQLPHRPTIQTLVEKHFESLKTEIEDINDQQQKFSDGTKYRMRVDKDTLDLLGLPYTNEDISIPSDKRRQQQGSGATFDAIQQHSTEIPVTLPKGSIEPSSPYQTFWTPHTLSLLQLGPTPLGSKLTTTRVSP